MSALSCLFNDCLEARGLSKRTISNYMGVMRSVTRHIKRSPLEFSEDDVRGYILHMIRERKFSPLTVNLHIDTLKTFYRLVAPINTTMANIRHMKAPAHLPMVLGRVEVLRMIDVTANIKHKAILMLLYSAGLRLSECAEIKPCHIESSRMKVRVEEGKGKRDRYTLLSAKTLEVLRAYYKAFRPSTYLFEGRGGEPQSRRMIGKIVELAGIRAGIEKRVHPHALRHSFATHLLEAGVSLPAIQKLLGHRNIKTTMVYLHISEPYIERVVSPMDLEVAHAE